MQIKHPKNIFYKMTYLIVGLADNTMCYILFQSQIVKCMALSVFSLYAVTINKS